MYEPVAGGSAIVFSFFVVLGIGPNGSVHTRQVLYLSYIPIPRNTILFYNK
jgi:hypothetical protein